MSFDVSPASFREARARVTTEPLVAGETNELFERAPREATQLILLHHPIWVVVQHERWNASTPSLQ